MKWEVRTMRSGTSFFDVTIYKKTVNRFWPLWAVNLVFWLFVLPIRGLMDLDPGGKSAYRFALNVGDMATDLGVVVALLGSLMVAMAVCSHMYNARSANFFGALPCRREGQFLSTYAAGLTILMGPNLLVFLLTLLVEVAGQSVVMTPLLFWLGALCAMEFFFYSFAVCLGQFAGHILALPVFYGIFNAIVIALYSLLDWVLDAYYFGFAGISGFWPSLVTWFTPVAMFVQMDIDALAVGGTEVIDIEGFHICGIYAIVAVVLTVCALLLYRRRYLETAGDIVAVKAMRPVFRYGVAICAGLFFGFLMEQMFGLTEVGMLLWMIIWGVIGCFVAQMLLDKTVRVFKKWKGAVAVVIAFLLLFAVVGFDLTGYETKVPDAEDVAAVRFSGLQGTPNGNGYSLSQVVVEDPAQIELVTQLHQMIVEAGEDGEVGSERRITFRVLYFMKDGTTMERHYSVPVGERTLALAQQIRDLPEVRRQAYNLDELEKKLTAGGRLESVQFWHVNRKEGYEDREYIFSGKTAQQLWEAVMQDFDQGLIGRHTVGTYEDDYTWRVEFKFRVPVTDAVVISPYGTVEAEPYAPAEENGWSYTYLEFAVQEDSAATLALLEMIIQPDNRYQEDLSLEDIMAGARG